MLLLARGEIGGAPTTMLAKEMASRVKQLRDCGWKIAFMKVKEGLTSQMHHRCGKRMESIKDPATGHVLRSWKCCTHCKCDKTQKHDNLLKSDDNRGIKVHRDKNAAKNMVAIVDGLFMASISRGYSCCV